MIESDVNELVEQLRREGNDLPAVEVKLAASSFPRSVASTLSAFANTPGGGVLVFGLDEAQDFTPVGVFDIVKCKAALASCARQSVEPPVTFDIIDLRLGAASLVIATIHELSASAKPCRVRANGQAFLRAYDGDYPLSQTEEQALIAGRDVPRFDQKPVLGANIEDLDKDLINTYTASCRASSRGLARFNDEEILYRTGVVAGPERIPSIAGLLALGIYPQQFFPNLVIQATAAPSLINFGKIRAEDSQRFDGPIPLMLEQALLWVQRNSRTSIRFASDGHGHDEPEYPLEAIRELVVNAIVHRDLGPHALTQAVTLKLEREQLVLTNPGGLWGLTVERLGMTGVTSARNGWLLRICQNIRFGADQRVIEALALGIPTVLSSLASVGAPPPYFHDESIRFTVRLKSSTTLRDRKSYPSTKNRGLQNTRRHNADYLSEILSSGPATLAALVASSHLSERQVQYALGLLRAEGTVRLRGGKGSFSSYGLAETAAAAPHTDRFGTHQLKEKQ